MIVPANPNDFLSHEKNTQIPVKLWEDAPQKTLARVSNLGCRQKILQAHVEDITNPQDPVLMETNHKTRLCKGAGS